MSNAFALQSIGERGWRHGFTNLLHKENGRWWHTSRWWVQSLIWLVIINGELAFVIWGLPLLEPDAVLGLTEAYSTFVQFMTFFPVFAVIIIVNGAIVGEKQSGTAAWILSAPVTRSSFILSKLLANALGFLLIVVMLQGVVGYIQLSLFGRRLLPFFPFLAELGLISLYLLFYLTLTMALGAFFDARGPVLGIAIGVVIASLIGIGHFLGAIAPWIAWIAPESLLTLAQANVTGESLPAAWPISIIAVFLYSALSVAAAIWRFNREEF
jgi:ABC-2 type transport system permease protein